MFLNQIDYIESLREYVKIHLGEKTIVTKSPISQFEEKLPNRTIYQDPQIVYRVAVKNQ